MSETIVFKPEFENKLKELKVKTRFVKNFKNRNKNRQTKKWLVISSIDEIAVKELNSKDSFFIFIDHAFLWVSTPEGYDFWIEIAEKYDEISMGL
jgi:hypothetical protein